jgi:pimeloyl-ACP methyl ester carboxylesterase
MPTLASRMALEVFLTPRRFQRPSPERDLLSLAELDVLSLPRTTPKGRSRRAHVNIPIWTWGEGPTVLLVHGWEGRGAQLGAMVAPLVLAGFRVATFDAPAHGSTPGKKTSLPAFARTLDQVATHLGPIHGVVAHSMGCASTMLAESMRTARGEQLAPELALIAPPGSIATYSRLFAETLGLTEAVRSHMLQRIEARYGVRFESFEPQALAAQSQARALVIHDQSDAFVPVSEGRALAPCWPRATYLETTGLGHHRILKDPTVISAVVDALTRALPNLRPGRPLGTCLDYELFHREERLAG